MEVSIFEKLLEAANHTRADEGWGVETLRFQLLSVSHFGAVQKPEQIKQLHYKEAELMDIMSTQILRISAELINPKTIRYYEFNPRVMLEIKTLSQGFSQCPS